MNTDNEDLETYVGWPHRIADLKVRLGQWIEERRRD